MGSTVGVQLSPARRCKTVHCPRQLENNVFSTTVLAISIFTTLVCRTSIVAAPVIAPLVCLLYRLQFLYGDTGIATSINRDRSLSPYTFPQF